MKNLMWVAKHDRTKTVESLLDTGKYTPEDVDEALILAAGNSYTDIVELLLKTDKCTPEGINEALIASANIT